MAMSYTQGGPGRPISREDRLCAELSISQAQMRRLEKENSELRQKVSSLARNKYETEAEYTRRLNAYKKEYAMKEAQSSATPWSSASTLTGTWATPSTAARSIRKPGRAADAPLVEDNVFVDGTEINLRYALKQTVDVGRIDSREEIEKLKFFRNYFFEDFYSLDTETAVAAIRQGQLNNELFMEAFKLFCCKKPVFDEFVTRALEMHGYVSDQVRILENVPVDWICDYIEAAASRSKHQGSLEQNTHANYRNSCVKSFITSNTAQLLGLLGDIAERRPGTLSLVFSREEFDNVLKNSTASSRRLVSVICKNGGLGYINERNFEQIPLQDLFLCYGSDCLE